MKKLRAVQRHAITVRRYILLIRSSQFTRPPLIIRPWPTSPPPFKTSSPTSAPILCNFDEFWIYDFNQQLFDPVEKIALADLPSRAEALAFLLPKPRKPLFNNNRVEVTREAAADLARLFRSLIKRGEDRARAQRFILQLLVTLVSEDMHLLPRQLLTRLIAECREKGENSYDLIGGLFRQMNTREPARGGRFTDVPYFNGGLFADIDPIDLLPAELDLLATAADRKWDMVKPEIFGTLFQSSMDSDERHAFGAHFTSEFDIRKVVGPAIVRPWREKMDAAWDKVGKLKEVLRDLRLFRVLDPACGSGNFLYVAYRELKRLEREILLRLSEISKGEPLETAVSIHQFHGIDIQPFAVELAKVTLMLAKEQEVRETAKLEEIEEGFLVLENPLPLDNLDKNILCADALFTEWPKADAIVGNPPYLGSRYIAQELGYDYARRLHERFPDVPEMADFCTHWFRLAHDALPKNGRAGLVATDTIRQNEAREASLDYVVNHGGTITDAVSTQVWTGDASVHVSIVNWIKGAATEQKTLTTQVGGRAGDPWKIEHVEKILTSLATTTDLSSAAKLGANKNSRMVFVGQYPFHEGFLLSPDEVATWLTEDPSLSGCLRPYMIGRDLVEHGKPTRWIIDFDEGSPKNMRDQNAENVHFVPVHGSVDGCHPFADHHHFRAFVGGDGDGFVVRVQGEEFDAVMLPGFFGDGFGGMVFFHGEAVAVFRVADGIELDEDDATLAGALRAGAEEVPGAVLDLRLHRVAADAGDEHAGFDGGARGHGPADFLGAAFRAPEAGGGFEAVNGDEAGELFLGGGGLGEAGEVAVFAMLVFPGFGAGFHDSQGSGDGDGLAEPAAEEREDLVFLAAERGGDVAGDLDELEYPLAAIGKGGGRRADGAVGQFRDGGEPLDEFIAEITQEIPEGEFC
ncbi:MAG: N-6 DNA methylase [Luteolibacter sp.]|nr:N-6 DNA methylase [Luteolibacter sp.]